MTTRRKTARQLTLIFHICININTQIMEFTVIKNQTCLKVVHKNSGQNNQLDTLQVVYKRQEKPVYYLYQ